MDEFGNRLRILQVRVNLGVSNWLGMPTLRVGEPVDNCLQYGSVQSTEPDAESFAFALSGGNLELALGGREADLVS